jgi:PKD repeat protein
VASSRAGVATLVTVLAVCGCLVAVGSTPVGTQPVPIDGSVRSTATPDATLVSTDVTDGRFHEPVGRTAQRRGVVDPRSTAVGPSPARPSGTATADASDPVDVAWIDGGGSRTPPADPSLAPRRRPVRFSACPGVRFVDGPVRLGADTDVRIRVRNAATGATVTFAPDAPETVPVDAVSVCPTDAVQGELAVRPADGGGEYRELSAPAHGPASPFRSGTYDPYAVAVLDGQGRVRGTSSPRRHGTSIPLEAVAFNGSALALEIGPPVPGDAVPVVVVLDDAGIVHRLAMRRAPADGVFVTSVAAVDFHPEETLYAELRRLDNSTAATGPTGPPLLTLFRVRILADERVDGPVVNRSRRGGDASGGPPPVIGDRPPTDPDGDGAYEDVDGDGEFSVLDVVAFLEAFDEPAVAGTPAPFDFDADGDVSVVDVVRLLAEL